jgi:hypothetical protein
MGIELRQNGKVVRLIHNGMETGDLYFPLRRGNVWMQPEKLETEQGVIMAFFEGAELSDRLTFSECLTP